ncbi:alpha-ketoglutarate-dependent dioxygenase AlkB [Aphanothece hegewaldii CCALA 016]|uniref:Alpha-ketoglutarate-dependent dioxygenase AlkB n=1 Tax=Aphanothece hegewaldii CCALA 016 TaxID=2107694 RepID=A0A2T1LTY3_9CHRO|nr:alpha-ketoglutarate-dependent dioxygenase AlkB [Aphanothece hegewaldii]PSF34514.1 alpha-ketoglutarate-dependent dioxygenase AlkB [Aphanothece hegewaldii CCALA 016]
MESFEQLNLFSDQSSLLSLDNSNQPKSSNPIKNGEQLPIEQGEIIYYSNFFEQPTSDFLYRELENNIKWTQDYLKIYGKSIALPRLTAWYGEPEKRYAYSGIEMNPHPWIEPLLFIKKEIELVTKVKFNSVLINFYRDGNDSVAWHSDDENELGEYPVIGSVSLGGIRRFMLKPKNKESNQKYELELAHGSFLLMSGETQKYWLHQVPKTKKQVKPRINLTFRIIH